MVPYIPVRAKIFHMLPDLVENLHSLIASQYTQRQTAPSVDVEISFFVSVIRSIGSPSLTRRRCQSCSGSASGTLCSRWHAKALLARSNQHLLIAGYRPAPSRCWEENGKSLSTKGRPHNDTKREAETLISLSSCDMLYLYCCM